MKRCRANPVDLNGVAGSGRGGGYSVSKGGVAGKWSADALGRPIAALNRGRYHLPCYPLAQGAVIFQLLQLSFSKLCNAIRPARECPTFETKAIMESIQEGIIIVIIAIVADLLTGVM